MKKRWILASTAVATMALTTGAVALDAKQRQWIFQPSDRAWGGSNRDMSGLEDVWIPLTESKAGGEKKKLHALWMPAASPNAPVPAGSMSKRSIMKDVRPSPSSTMARGSTVHGPCSHWTPSVGARPVCGRSLHLASRYRAWLDGIRSSGPVPMKPNPHGA